MHTYKEGTALSKEKKLAKKEAKAQKKAAKIEKQQAKAYAKLVKDIEKKNAKAEKKANKKGKPFVPVAIPTMEEAFASGQVNKKKQIVKMIILLLLIAYVIYFLVMWFTYVAPIKNVAEDPEDDGSSVAQEYDRYVSDKIAMETPDYSVSEAKNLLKQVIHDNWQEIGYKSDVSSSSINQTGMDNINNTRCYMFTCSGKKFAVSQKLQSVYLIDSNGTAVPFTFHGTEYILD